MKKNEKCKNYGQIKNFQMACFLTFIRYQQTTPKPTTQIYVVELSSRTYCIKKPRNLSYIFLAKIFFIILTKLLTITNFKTPKRKKEKLLWKILNLVLLYCYGHLSAQFFLHSMHTHSNILLCVLNCFVYVDNKTDRKT